MNLYKVTLGLTTGATYNMTNVHVFKAAQARRAYFLLFFSDFQMNCVLFAKLIKFSVKKTKLEKKYWKKSGNFVGPEKWESGNHVT